MTRTKHALKTRELCYCALMAVLLAVCSWISIPAAGPFVPFTMQTFGVFLALSLLGGRLGGLAVLAYLLLGAMGLPVFSGFTGGAARLLGPTGGYLVGFLFSALVYWALEGRVRGKLWRKAALLALAMAVCYAFGTAWFLLVYARGAGPVSLLSALGACVFPFLLPDALKLALALSLSRSLEKRLRL